MPFTYVLLAGIVGSVAVSSLAAAALRRSQEDLADDIRVRIYQRERSLDWAWRAAEWAGVILILLGMFTTIISRQACTRVLVIAAGMALFCAANTASAWFTSLLCRREAPETKTSRTALLSASVVTLTEAILMGIVLWIVSSRLGWLSEKPNPESAQNERAAETDNGIWIDEAAALKELSQQDKEYIRGLIESGALRTKTVAGKRLFEAGDVEKLKHKKKDAIPD
jgi:hypothetical protein